MATGERIGNYWIDFGQTYYIAYAGGTRELPAKDYKEYKKAISLPPSLARAQELLKLPKEKNPNVVPIPGVKLLELIKDAGFIPLFDKFFEHTHLLKCTDLIVYESIKAKSYEIAMNIN